MNSQISETKNLQPAQTGGASCGLGSAARSRAPLFSQEKNRALAHARATAPAPNPLPPPRPGMSRALQAIFERAEGRRDHPPRANKTQIPEWLRRSGRVLLVNSNGDATYIGRNGGAVCEVCGTESAQPNISKVWLRKFCLALARKRYHKLPLRKDKPCMNHPQEYATKLAKIVDRFAAVLCETAAVKGDAFTVDDLEALITLMDIVNEIDDTAIPRMVKAKKKKLSRSKSG